MTESSVVNNGKSGWRQAIKPYAQANTGRSIWQIVNTIVPYIALWVLMYYSLRVSYWLTLLLAIPAHASEQTTRPLRTPYLPLRRSNLAILTARYRSSTLDPLHRLVHPTQ